MSCPTRWRTDSSVCPSVTGEWAFWQSKRTLCPAGNQDQHHAAAQTRAKKHCLVNSNKNIGQGIYSSVSEVPADPFLMAHSHSCVGGEQLLREPALLSLSDLPSRQSLLRVCKSLFLFLATSIFHVGSQETHSKAVPIIPCLYCCCTTWPGTRTASKASCMHTAGLYCIFLP